MDVVTVGQRNPRRRGSTVRRPLLVEVMGPAASGKTTLTRSLCTRHEGIRAGMGIGKLGHVGPSSRMLGGLLPTWAKHHRDDRWLDRREMRSIARLETWSRTLDRGRAPDAYAIVFDHGPLYRLARLREFGPSLTRSESFRAWWLEAHRTWLESLDVVVWLDAPDEVLLDRIDRRGHWYLSAERDAGARRDFLARYRRALEGVLDPDSPSPAILRFRSDRQPIEEIADATLTALAALAASAAPASDVERKATR